MDKPKTRNTYGLYQGQFDKLAEVIACFELGLREEAWEIIEDTLSKDRETFDLEKLEAKVAGHIKGITRYRPELKERLLD